MELVPVTANSRFRASTKLIRDSVETEETAMELVPVTANSRFRASTKVIRDSVETEETAMELVPVTANSRFRASTKLISDSVEIEETAMELVPVTANSRFRASSKWIRDSIETEENTMEGIPEDLVAEILLRLPVESLLRIRCVSKKWRNLIDSPNFIKSQLNLPNKPRFVMLLDFHKKLRIHYSELDSDYIENPSPNFKEVTVPRRDLYFSDIFDVVGHCNGLLCFVRTNYCSFILLNPSTGKHIHVPPLEPQGDRFRAMGFGYDRVSDDYKVVAFEPRDSVLWIYSLKSNSWKNIVDFPYVLDYGNSVFVNGALHWIVCHSKEDAPDFIFALNLGNLEFILVPLPSDYSKNLSHLGVLDGCLFAILSEYPEIDDDGENGEDDDDHAWYDLWVMKEYGSKESWTRLSTYNGFYDIRDFLFVRYGNLLVQCKFRSFWREIGYHIPLHMCKPVLYEPSLVCARSGIEEDKKDSPVIS